ncbi:MAG: hypothetical protein JW934_09245 [Anaerolineae bacterium]|nr:hypothetical protein [Anaerolineae bacterium]
MTNSDLLHQARQALQSGDRERARRLLADALRANLRDAQAWLLMSEAVEQRAHKLDCLMRVLAIEPENATALAQLARLNPQPEPPSAKKTPPLSMPSAEPMVLPVQSGLMANMATRNISPVPSPAERLEIERQHRQGRRSLMLAGALIISMFCGIVLLTLTVTQVVPRGQAIRQERLSVPPTLEPILYQATLWCSSCDQAGDPVILWEKVGDGVSRGGKVGELPHNTTVNVHKEVWSEPEGRTYYHISAGDQKGWVPETFIKE